MLARTHKTLIWERTRHVQQIPPATKYFPTTLKTFNNLNTPNALYLLTLRPQTPPRTAKLTRAQIRGRAQTRPPPPHCIQDRCASLPRCAASTSAARLTPPTHATVHSLDRLSCPQTRSQTLGAREHFGQCAAVRSSSVPARLRDRSSAPGCSPNSATTRTVTPTPKPVRTTPSTSPITRASGKRNWSPRPVRRTTTAHRRAHHPGLLRPAHLTRRPRLLLLRTHPRNRTQRRPAAIANRLVGILHGCLKLAPSTTRPPPGLTANRSSPPLDIQAPGMSSGMKCLPREEAAP